MPPFMHASTKMRLEFQYSQPAWAIRKNMQYQNFTITNLLELPAPAKNIQWYTLWGTRRTQVDVLRRQEEQVRYTLKSLNECAIHKLKKNKCAIPKISSQATRVLQQFPTWPLDVSPFFPPLKNKNKVCSNRVETRNKKMVTSMQIQQQLTISMNWWSEKNGGTS